MEGINLKNVQGAQSPKIQQNKSVSEPQVKEKDHSCANVVLGGLAALAAIGAAAVLIKNGQASKVVKDMDVNKFKAAGNKFVKGKALTKSNKPFSGTLYHFKKDGTKIVLKYEDGLLRTSEKMSGDISNKQRIYGYDKSGSLSSVRNVKGYKVFEKTQNGSISRVKLNDGKKDVIYNKSTGETLIDDNCFKRYYQNGKKLYSGESNCYFTKYGENGKELITKDYSGFVIRDAKGNKLFVQDNLDFIKYNKDGIPVKNRIDDAGTAYGDACEMINNEKIKFMELCDNLYAPFKK